MTSDSDNADVGRRDRRHFETTHWSMVMAAVDNDSAAQQALADLCELYWYPLYAYVRRKGYSAADAQDLTQAFFARLLEKQSLAQADPKRGRFRAFLLSSLDNFLVNEYKRARTQKRGGGHVRISIDMSAGESRMDLEPAHDLTPDRLYERRWTLTLLELVVARLEAEYAAANKTTYFEQLKPALGGARDAIDYDQVSGELSISKDNARQAAHRMRKRYRELLREEVARTINDQRSKRSRRRVGRVAGVAWLERFSNWCRGVTSV